MTWWNPLTWRESTAEDNFIVGLNDTVEDIRADIDRCSRRYSRTGDVYWAIKRRDLRKRLKAAKRIARSQP